MDKRLLFLLFTLVVLLLWPIFPIVNKERILYVVDGEIGFDRNQLPPKSQIYRYEVLDRREAMYIYGDRGRNGAMLINTNEYIQNHYRKNKPRRTRFLIAPQVLFEEEKLYIMLLFLICYVFSATQHRVVRFFSKIGPRHSFRSEETTLSPLGSPIWYILVLLPAVALVVLFEGSFGGLIEEAVLFNDMGSVRFFLLTIYSIVLFAVALQLITIRSKLIVSAQGIRGVVRCVSPDAMWARFREVDIRWQDIKDASLNTVSNHKGRTIFWTLVLHTQSPGDLEIVIVINEFDETYLVACLNYYYSEYTHDAANPFLPVV